MAGSRSKGWTAVMLSAYGNSEGGVGRKLCAAGKKLEAVAMAGVSDGVAAPGKGLLRLECCDLADATPFDLGRCWEFALGSERIAIEGLPCAVSFAARLISSRRAAVGSPVSYKKIGWVPRELRAISQPRDTASQTWERARGRLFDARILRSSRFVSLLLKRSVLRERTLLAERSNAPGDGHAV